MNMSKGLTNEYVEGLSKQFLNNSNFLGVFPCDIHPDINKNRFCVIFNTGKSSSSGEHFVSIFCNQSKLFYFDSFGNACDNKPILNFMKKNIGRRMFYYNNEKVQSDLSNFCGFYSFAFLLSQENNIPPKTFLQLFDTTNLKDNDNVVIRFICKVIKINE